MLLLMNLFTQMRTCATYESKKDATIEQHYRLNKANLDE
jgi:hypothetical protein